MLLLSYRYAFDTFDTNHDEKISFEEFLLAVSASSQGDLDTRLSVAFDLYDISDDGHIDQKEMAKLISAMVKYSIIKDCIFVFLVRSCW
jgi:Ca2+-binding EF-hand superfamily protein